jgi:hypothetical protein
MSKILLIFITAWIGYYLVDLKSADINRQWSEQRELVEQRTKFVQQFTLLGQSRLYYAEVYVLNVESDETKEVLDRSWQNYIEAVSNWNQHNVLNPIFLEEYYGKDLKNKYHDDLLINFSNLHYKVLQAREGKDVEDFPEVLEKAKNSFFVFSEILMFGNQK